MWCVKCVMTVGLGLALASGAVAQEVEATAPAGSISPPHVSLGADIEGRNAEFVDIAAQVEVAEAQVALAEALLRLREAQTKLAGGGAGPSTQPLLIGLFSGDRASYAEFAIGSVTRRARVGEYIADGLRLASIDVGSVVVVNDQGRRQKLFLNKRQAATFPASSSVAAPTQQGSSAPFYPAPPTR